jgi:Sulfotransferase family
LSAETTATKVLYVAGSGRSGSTILDRILGQLEGFFSVGELCNLWDRGLLANRRCGCGTPVRDCPTWKSILALGFGDPAEIDAARMVALRGRRVRARYIPAALAARRGAHAPGSDEFLDTLATLYRAVQHDTGCRVVVDSSKSPVYGRLLATLPSVDLHVLHLVRDPRATAWSWLRRKRLPDFGDDRLMQRQPPLKSAALWTLWQAATELFFRGAAGRYLRVRYEDFVRDPLAAVEAALGLVGEAPAGLPFTSGAAVELEPTHSVSGNPDRFRSGTVALRPDAEWATSMRRADRLLVTAVTWPLLLRYRYPLVPRG